MADEGIGNGNSARPRKLTLAPAEAAGECARKAIAASLEALSSNQEPATRGEVEAMHQLRVSSRRLRASIQVFEKVLYAAQVRIYTRDIKWIAGLAGAVRDCDVKALTIQEQAKNIDPELAKSIDPILAALANRRAFEHTALCEALKSKRYSTMLTKLSAPSLKKASAQRMLGIMADDVLDPIADEVSKRGRKLARDSVPRRFHKLRIRIKRLRYALDMLSSLGAKHHKKTLARLEELQDRFGEYNDVNMTSAWLMSLADNVEMPARTMLAAGALIQSLGDLAQNLRRQSIKQWRKFQNSGLLRDALDEIHRAGQLAPAEAHLISPDTAGVEAVSHVSSNGQANDQDAHPQVDSADSKPPAPQFTAEPVADAGTHS